MIVYRISKTKYAEDLMGEGARLFGGRWNNKTVSCVYTSESRALAILEYSVNVNIDDVPRALSIISIEVPVKGIHTIQEKDLPGDWRASPAPSSTKTFGSKILSAAKDAVVKIPSVVIPDEFNYLLNPLHPQSKQFRIINIRDFVYDVRLKEK